MKKYFEQQKPMQCPVCKSTEYCCYAFLCHKFASDKLSIKKNPGLPSMVFMCLDGHVFHRSLAENNLVFGGNLNNKLDLTNE